MILHIIGIAVFFCAFLLMFVLYRLHVISEEMKTMRVHYKVLKDDMREVWSNTKLTNINVESIERNYFSWKDVKEICKAVYTELEKRDND